MLFKKEARLSQKKLKYSHSSLLWSFISTCMKFEVTTILAIHTSAIKRRLLKLLSSMVIGIQHVVMHQITYHTYSSMQSNVTGSAWFVHWGRVQKQGCEGYQKLKICGKL